METWLIGEYIHKGSDENMEISRTIVSACQFQSFFPLHHVWGIVTSLEAVKR